MFNWTTTTIINSLEDATTGDKLVKVWKNAENGSGFSGSYPVIKIKRDHTFETRYITNIYKAVAKDPVKCKATLDFTKIVTKLKALVDAGSISPQIYGRLAFYIALEGSEESIYANDMYQKGKPFSIGFGPVTITKDSVVEDAAKAIVKNLVKNATNAIYGKRLFKLTAYGETSVVLEGTSEFQRFNFINVAVDDSSEEVLVSDYNFFFENEDSGISGIELNERGQNGFGTYLYMIRNLQLPTVHNTRWLHLREDEKPVVGAKYTQYIVNYCAPSMANPGLTVVGQHNMSATTHVFWVNENVADQFEAFLVDAGINPEAVALAKGNKVKEDAKVGTEFSVNHEQTIEHTKSKKAAGSASDRV